MISIRRLEKLSQAELSSLILKLELRGFKELNASEARFLPPKHFFRQRSEASVSEMDDVEYWLIVWSEPLFE